jgi:hypothetical protein
MRENRSRSLTYAAIAQSVERLICNQQVGSSILSGGLKEVRAGARPLEFEWITLELPSR